MAIKIRKEDCCGCHACAQICPQNCIRMAADAEGFWYPEIDETRCIQCELCDKVCPALKQIQEEAEMPSAWACMSCDREERLCSSSGGVFSLLAKQVLRKGGVVFGAAFSDDFRSVEHISVETEADLEALRGSKYLQSWIGQAYSDAKKYLEAGRCVLFSGTPCQIEGLRSFLRKDYELLLCVDIVCHGVPSPWVWEKYADWQEAHRNAALCGVHFRNKQRGWKNYLVSLDFSDGEKLVVPYGEDAYFRAFLQNVSLRPSCGNCHFKKINRVSDITLADFWGIQHIYPELDDDQGTSLVLLHTQKGENCFHEIQGLMRTKEVTLGEAICHNSAMIESVIQHPRREEFFEAVGQDSFDRAVDCVLREKVTVKTVIYDVVNRMGLLPVIKKLLHRE